MLGFAGVVFGALVGLVRGCAVQIVFAGRFLATVLTTVPALLVGSLFSLLS